MKKLLILFLLIIIYFNNNLIGQGVIRPNVQLNRNTITMSNVVGLQDALSKKENIESLRNPLNSVFATKLNPIFQGVVTLPTGNLGFISKYISNGVLGNSIMFESNNNVGIGTVNPSAKLDIIGNIKIQDGTQGLGKVLTSDANGTATWQTLNNSGGSGSSLPLTFSNNVLSTNSKLDVTDDLGVNGNSDLQGSLSVNGTGFFVSPVIIDAPLTVNGGIIAGSMSSFNQLETNTLGVMDSLGTNKVYVTPPSSGNDFGLIFDSENRASVPDLLFSNSFVGTNTTVLNIDGERVIRLNGNASNNVNFTYDLPANKKYKIDISFYNFVSTGQGQQGDYEVEMEYASGQTGNINYIIHPSQLPDTTFSFFTPQSGQLFVSFSGMGIGLTAFCKFKVYELFYYDNKALMINNTAGFTNYSLNSSVDTNTISIGTKSQPHVGFSNTIFGNYNLINCINCNDNVILGSKIADKYVEVNSSVIIGNGKDFNSYLRSNKAVLSSVLIGSNSLNKNESGLNISIGNDIGNIGGQYYSNIFLGGYLSENSLLTSNVTNNIVLGINTAKKVSSSNIYLGNNTAVNNTSNENVIVGHNSFANNLTGTNNVVLGNNAFKVNQLGNNNISIGNESNFGVMSSPNSTFDRNIALGNRSMYLKQGNTSDNIVIGYNSASSIDNASSNIIIGNQSASNYTGINNVTIGHNSLGSNIGNLTNIKNQNTVIGAYALGKAVQASNNIAIGVEAGMFNRDDNFNTSPSSCIYIGNNTLTGVSTSNAGNEIVLGNNISGRGNYSITIGAGNNSGKIQTNGSVIVRSNILASLSVISLTTAEINNITSPTENMLVWNTTLKNYCFYNGTSWQRIAGTNMN